MFGFVTSFAAFRPAFQGAAVSARSARAGNVTTMVASKAMPFMEAPPKLDGTRAGDFGFDPLYMSENMDQDWMCAAELKNGRVAMVGVLGMFVQEFVHLPNPMYAEVNPLKAITTVPTVAWVQILFFIFCVEMATFTETFSNKGADYGFDPLGLFGKIDEKKMREKEIINGRLAMIGAIGIIAQTLQTGKPIVAQLTSF